MNNGQGIEEQPQNLFFASFNKKAQLLTERNNWAQHLHWFHDGSDTYGATFWRCWFNFFFQLHIPNQWSNKGCNVDGSNLGGPVIAIVIAMTIIGTGYAFRKATESRWLKAQLTDEFLLAYYTMQKNEAAAADAKAQLGADFFERMDALIKHHIELDRSTDPSIWGSDQKGDEAQRIAMLEAFAATHHQQIMDDLLAPKYEPPIVTDPSEAQWPKNLRYTWEKVFDLVVYYAYAQWIVWILATLVLNQVIEDYGFTEDSDTWNSPNFFDDKAGRLAVDFQLIVPFLISLIAWGYTLYSENVVQPKFAIAQQKAKEAELEELRASKLNSVRGFYLKHKDVVIESPLPSSTPGESVGEGEGESGKAQPAAGVVTENTQAQVEHEHFYVAQTMTWLTTFLGNFLLLNIAAWPLSYVGSEVLDIDTTAQQATAAIFSVAVVVAALQATLKVFDMRKDEHDTFKQYAVGSKNDSTKHVLQAAPMPGMFSFLAHKEQYYTTAYFVIGRIVGSGGLLLSRVLFNGGMGCFRGLDSDMAVYDRQNGISEPGWDILRVGLLLTAVMITLNLYQYYKASERESALGQAKDNALKAKAPPNKIRVC